MTAETAPGWDPKATPYPQARRDENKVDVYQSKKDGEVKVVNPYHWLEVPPSQSEETKAWVDAQVAFTSAYIDKVKDERAAIHKELEKNFNYPRFTAPQLKDNGYYYYFFNSGLQPQAVFYRVDAAGLHATKSDEAGPGGEVFFDPNLLSKDGTVSLTTSQFSKDGKWFAYGISRSGSDWFTIYVRPTDKPYSSATAGKDGEDKGRLDEEIRFVKFSNIEWTHDGKGFFYQRFLDQSAVHSLAEDDKAGTETDVNVDARLYYHRVGTPQSEDILIIDKDPEIPTAQWHARISEDGKWLTIHNPKDTDTKERVKVARMPSGPVTADTKFDWVHIAPEYEFELSGVYEETLQDGSGVFWFVTNRDAPNSKLVKVTVRPDNSFEYEDVVPEAKDAVISSFMAFMNGEKLLLVYGKDVKDEVWVFDLKTGKKLYRLGEDLVGTMVQIAGRTKDDHLFINFVSFTNPGTIYRVGQAEGNDRLELVKFRETKVEGIRGDDFESKQVFFNSKDGTRVPMFLTYLKGTPLDGTAPVYQYQYGGFNIALTPSFSSGVMTFVKRYGAIFAWVNARGGSEYGEEWHKGGSAANKPNTFDDTLAASKWLVENKYAAKGKIILSGGSNGGLTVAASCQRATEEHGIGAGLVDVGVLDMLKFSTWTIGAAWRSDFGDPQKPEEFDWLYPISPLHNIDTKKVYPTMVIATADHDDRVVPAHSFKYAAALQHALPLNPNPLLARIDTKSGHGAGKSTAQRINEAADKYAIITQALGLKPKVK